MRKKLLRLAFPAAAFAASAGLFLIGVSGGYIGIDDWLYTDGCPFVKDGLSWANISRAFLDVEYGGIWMPATFISYMADVSLFGGGFGVYHAVDAVLHGINAVLVFILLSELLSDGKTERSRVVSIACLAGTLLWALHPMRAEAVSYAGARKELLWSAFALLSLLEYAKFLRDARKKRFWSSFAFCVLSLLSKPTAVCVPFLAATLHWYRRSDTKRRWTWLLVPFAASAAVAAVTLVSQTNPEGTGSPGVLSEPLWWRTLNATVSLGLYAWNTVSPSAVHWDYRAVFGGWPVNGCLGLVSVAIVAAVAALVVRRSSGRVREAIVFAALVFLFSIGPTLGVFAYVNSDQAMADRYAYFPHIAMAFLVAFSASRARGRTARIVLGACSVLASVEAVLAVPVIKSFENASAAYSRVLGKDPGHWRALRVVGNDLCARQGRMDEGIAMLRKSLALRPSQTTADSLAYVLAVRGADGDFAETKRLGAAIAANPRLDKGGMMLDALGIAAMREGDWLGAARFFGAGLTVPSRNHSPDRSLLWFGQCLANAGREKEAVAILERAAKSSDREVGAMALRSLEAISDSQTRPPFLWNPR